MNNADRERLINLRRKASRQLRSTFGIETDVAFLLRLLDQPRGRFGEFRYTTEDLEYDRCERQSLLFRRRHKI
jgi:hypothetical protein